MSCNCVSETRCGLTGRELKELAGGLDRLHATVSSLKPMAPGDFVKWESAMFQVERLKALAEVCTTLCGRDKA